MLTLHHIPASCSTACVIALAESGAEHAVEHVDYEKGELAGVAFRRMNPMGRVPVLVHGDIVVTENISIQIYIANLFPQSGLMPFEKARVPEWISALSWAASHLHPDLRRISRRDYYADTPAGRDDVAAKGLGVMHNLLSVLDNRLSASDWVAAGQYTSADPYTLVFVSMAQKYAESLRDFRHVNAWAERVLQRPAVHAAFAAEDNFLLGRVLSA